MEPVETGIAREIAESFKTDGDIDSESQRRLAAVYERVPFYRQQFDAAGVRPGDVHGLEDLARLPFTRKSDQFAYRL